MWLKKQSWLIQQVVIYLNVAGRIERGLKEIKKELPISNEELVNQLKKEIEELKKAKNKEIRDLKQQLIKTRRIVAKYLQSYEELSHGSSFFT